MTDQAVITARNLSKVYKLYDRPADRVRETFSPFGKIYHRPFHALSDISLDVYKGETVGIIGRNGSGKSTFLQLVCGILQPTSGELRVQGRISALLELGAGFNPEFTGRQNVYLNGSILGLSKEEIDDHLEDILRFADIGEFIDQPVKSYSSGMYVRLAFAVAINVEPDILVVDEALSVGDESFQRKCFSRINRLQERGRTILFVSHSASSVIELCSRAILLDHGEMLLAGAPKRVVELYQKLLYATPEHQERLRQGWKANPERHCLKDTTEIGSDPGVFDGNTAERGQEPAHEIPEEGFDPGLVPVSTVEYQRRGARIENPRIETGDGSRVNCLRSGETYWYCYEVSFERESRGVRFGMLIKTVKGIELSGYAMSLDENGPANVPAGSRWRIRFPFACRLNPGVYFLNAGVLARIGEEEEFLDRMIDAAVFRVRQKRDPMVTATVDLVSRPEINQLTGENHG